MRRVTLSNERVQKALMAQCILVAHDSRNPKLLGKDQRKVRLVATNDPRANCQSLHFGEGGENFWTCFCTDEGMILNFSPGFRTPDAIMEELRIALDLKSMGDQAAATAITHGGSVQMFGCSLREYLSGVRQLPCQLIEPKTHE